MACENFKEEKKLSVVLELICKACSVGDCIHHQPQLTAKDSVTGLAVEARCICKNCRRGE